MTDILDEIPITLSCPVDNCPGEIASTFGRLRAHPMVTCPVCRVKANAEFSEEDLQAARTALAELEGPGGDSAAEAGADGGT